MAAFGPRSEANLQGVHPDLVAVHRFAIQKYDHSVDDGARTLAEQAKNVARGVSKTMASKHLPQDDGLAHATDSRPYPHPDWRLVERSIAAVRAIDPTLAVFRFYHFQGYMLGIADHMGIDLRQGIDWNEDTQVGDQSFIDLPHNELAPKPTGA